MNIEERCLLRSPIAAVRTHNTHAWWQLKREIYDYGNQTYYPAQSFFERPAEAALGMLSPLALQQLRMVWSGEGIAPTDDAALRKHYAREVVLEVVRRARSAALRTVAW